jgi:hypothetical protein
MEALEIVKRSRFNDVVINIKRTPIGILSMLFPATLNVEL